MNDDLRLEMGNELRISRLEPAEKCNKVIPVE